MPIPELTSRVTDLQVCVHVLTYDYRLFIEHDRIINMNLETPSPKNSK